MNLSVAAMENQKVKLMYSHGGKFNFVLMIINYPILAANAKFYKCTSEY
uniref:Uncharacterized protein n=1 Tax=Solanum lycopersicum TaxID=4081 RepID=K4CRT6_SOLLC